MTAAQIVDPEQSQKEIEELSQRNLELEEQLAYLKEQLEWFKRQIFGQRSEKAAPVNSQQLLLEGFNELPMAEEELAHVPAHQRRKIQRKGEDKIKLSPDLPVETTILDIPEKEKICPKTGVALVKIGEEVTQRIAHKPGSYYIKEIIRPKYAVPGFEEKGILTAELPETLLPKCRADESFLAEILVSKFGDHLPLHRIAEIATRQGIIISRKLLSHWVIRCGLALKPLYDEMLKKVLESNNIFIDETPVLLQDVGKCKTAYMWVVVGGNESDPPYRVYDFRENRCHDHVLDILGNYQGTLHSDKFAAYEKLAHKKIIHWSPCWAHIRRKFFEANTDPTFQKWVLRKIRYLYMLEKVAWHRTPEARLMIRQKKEIPIIDELIKKIKAKLTDGKVLPKSKLREALGYFCGLIPYLKNYTQKPFARLDNNVAERAVRPLAIGRKNWLFFGSSNGGEAGAVILSLVQTCRGLGINPREYMEDVMKRIMGHNAQKLHELLPDQWEKNRLAAAAAKKSVAV